MKFKRRFVKKFKYNYKTRFLLPLLVLVCVSLGLGYAYLQTDLAIVGVTKLKDNEWNVHFDNIQPVPGSVEPVTAPSISELTTVSFSAQLENPGDKYEFYIDVVNSGTIDAMVDSLILLPELTTAQAKYLSYEVTYRNGAPISQHELLTQGQTRTLKVSFKYVENSDTSNYPQENTTFNISATVNYVQANNQAIYYVGANPCTYNGELVNNASYVNGQYTYTYNSSNNGWKVVFTDKNSTDPATSTLCSSINNYPIISMSGMFRSSKASSLDFSSFDTSHVTDMSGMFASYEGNSLDLRLLDTSNVNIMTSMFTSCKSSTIDFSNFNTSNVTNMGQMFTNNKANTLNLSSFDTSNVTNMTAMFASSEATSINLSSFNTSKTTELNSMFNQSKVIILDLSSFDTSKVDSFIGVFYGSVAKTINISNWNFNKAKSTSGLFSNCTNLENIIMENVDTSEVTNMTSMFYNTSGLGSLDLSSFDTSNVTNMEGMFLETSATTGYGKTQADCDRLNASSGKPSGLTFVVKS